MLVLGLGPSLRCARWVFLIERWLRESGSLYQLTRSIDSLGVFVLFGRKVWLFAQISFQLYSSKHHIASKMVNSKEKRAMRSQTLMKQPQLSAFPGQFIQIR